MHPHRPLCSACLYRSSRRAKVADNKSGNGERSDDVCQNHDKVCLNFSSQSPASLSENSRRAGKATISAFRGRNFGRQSRWGQQQGSFNRAAVSRITTKVLMLYRCRDCHAGVRCYGRTEDTLIFLEASPRDRGRKWECEREQREM